MPMPRRQRTCSPSMSIDSAVVIGTPSWTTIEAADGLAVFRAMNIRAKLAPPISWQTTIIRHSGLGAGSSHGRVHSITTMNRAPA